jgi:GMP synthase (glutamine-hydrolysing)
MRPLAIAIAGDPVPSARRESGTFSEMIRRSVGPAWVRPWLDLDARDGRAFPDPQELAGLVVTGSSASVTERAPWMLAIEAYLRQAVVAELPVFGICFGHQLLGQALGGRVESNPRGRQVGTVQARVLGADPLLEPELAPLWVNTTHRDAVVELPVGAAVLADTPLDPHAFVRFGARAWGVQFHPEFDQAVMRAYIGERREILRDEGFDADGLIADATDADPGRVLMVRFVERYVRA